MSSSFPIYGDLNAALVIRSSPSKKTTSPGNDALSFYDLSAESPEDWACRFYWETYFEQELHSKH